MIDVKSTIPHREPFLFVDKVLEISEDSILAEKIFHSSESFYKGHYPNNPITPGVILCEAVFQTAAVLVLEKFKNDPIGSTPVLARIEDARFKAIVKPDETLLLSAQFVERYGKFLMMSGEAKKKDGSVVLKIKFSLALV